MMVHADISRTFKLSVTHVRGSATAATLGNPDVIPGEGREADRRRRLSVAHPPFVATRSWTGRPQRVDLGSRVQISNGHPARPYPLKETSSRAG